MTSGVALPTMCTYTGANNCDELSFGPYLENTAWTWGRNVERKQRDMETIRPSRLISSLSFLVSRLVSISPIFSLRFFPKFRLFFPTTGAPPQRPSLPLTRGSIYCNKISREASLIIWSLQVQGHFTSTRPSVPINPSGLPPRTPLSWSHKPDLVVVKPSCCSYLRRASSSWTWPQITAQLVERLYSPVKRAVSVVEWSTFMPEHCTHFHT